MYLSREKYLKQLIAGEGNRLIKVITGIRRCGKSFLLFKIFTDYLRRKGINDSHIIQIDFEDVHNYSLRQPEALVAHIDKQLIDTDRYYILLDEVQHVDRFEDVLNSYMKIDNIDIYVTGSNSRFLSSDIITEFRGRGDEIRIYPLSFAEFYQAVGGDKSDALRDYFIFGGLPQILELDNDRKKQQYLKNLYLSVYLRDLQERNNITKKQEFDELIKIIASSIGSPCNPLKLSNTFKSVGKSNISPNTISTYLTYIEDAFLVEVANRYDVKGKRYINSLSKYYFCDPGLRNALLDFRQQEGTHIMENIIYTELRARGFSVDVGNVEVRQKDTRKQLEVDFVANLGSKRYYIQSAYAIPDNEKMKQERASLNQINDNFKKIIIVNENIKPWYNENGILTLGLFDFLLNPNSTDY